MFRILFVVVIFATPVFAETDALTFKLMSDPVAYPRPDLKFTGDHAFVARGDFNSDGEADILISQAGSKQIIGRFRSIADGKTLNAPPSHLHRLLLKSFYFAVVEQKARRISTFRHFPNGEIEMKSVVSWDRVHAPGATLFAPQLIDVEAPEVLWILAMSLEVKTATGLNSINSNELPYFSDQSAYQSLSRALSHTPIGDTYRTLYHDIPQKMGLIDFVRKNFGEEMVERLKKMPADIRDEIFRVSYLGLPKEYRLSDLVRKKLGNCSSKSLLMALQLAVNGAGSYYYSEYVRDIKDHTLWFHAYLTPEGIEYEGIEKHPNDSEGYMPSPGRYRRYSTKLSEFINRYSDVALEHPWFPPNRPVHFHVEFRGKP